MEDASTEFNKLQYSMLRDQSFKLYDRQHWWLIYVTSLNGGIYFWIGDKLINPTGNKLIFVCVALSVSVVSTIAGFLMFRISARTAGWMLSYCSKIEQKFVGSDGWSEYYSECARGIKWIGTKNLISFLFIAQAVISIAALIAAIMSPII